MIALAFLGGLLLTLFFGGLARRRPRVICAWCRCELGDGIAYPGQPVSHGICEECAETQRQEIEQLNQK